MATLTVPQLVPTPVEDAHALRKACQGWGTDEKGVIEVIAHRDVAHRKLVRLAYEELYKEDLIKRLESVLFGDFERAVYRWMFEPAEREAIILNTAIKEADTRVIIESACVNSPRGLLIVKQAYHARYKHSLEEDVAFKFTGDYRKLLVPLVSTYRYNGTEFNGSVAKSEAKILHVLIKQKFYNHEMLIRILSTRSKAQLNATFNHYKNDFATSITKDVSGIDSSDFAAAIRAVIRCIVSPKEYFERLLRSAVNNPGSEDVLTRVIVMHAEKDLKEIKEMFEKSANAALDAAIGKAAHGDHKKFLLALLGN